MQVYLIIMLVTLATAFLAVRLYRFLASNDGLFTRKKLPQQDGSKSYRRKRGGTTQSATPTSRRKQTHRGMPMVNRRSALVSGSIQKPWGW